MKILHTRIILIIIMLLLVALAYKVFIDNKDENRDIDPLPRNSSFNVNRSGIVDTQWKWTRTEAVEDGTESSNSFTITLSKDKRVQVTTDCNSGQGLYTLEDSGSMEFNAIATTKMFCEGSMESEFLSQLEQVSSYEYKDDMLIFTLKSTEEKMEFTR